MGDARNGTSENVNCIFSEDIGYTSKREFYHPDRFVSFFIEKNTLSTTYFLLIRGYARAPGREFYANVFSTFAKPPKKAAPQQKSQKTHYVRGLQQY